MPKVGECFALKTNTNKSIHIHLPRLNQFLRGEKKETKTDIAKGNPVQLIESVCTFRKILFTL